MGAKPKWSAHADWSNQSGEGTAFSTTIPPWRNQSLGRMTTTRTAEGLADQQKHNKEENIDE